MSNQFVFATYNKWFTLATGITCIRLLLIPFLMHAIGLKNWTMAAFLFGSAAVTDLFDGAIARWRNEQSWLGSWLDPLADKLLIISCLITLFTVHTFSMPVPFWFVGLVCVKELLLIVGALYVHIQYRLAFMPTRLGKYAACVHALFITYIFFVEITGYTWIWMYYGLLYGAAALTILSFIHYSIFAWERITNTKMG